MDLQLQRLLPLLLFLLSWPLFLRDGNRTPLPYDAADLHPIVLLPGHSCTQLLARLTDDYEPAAASPTCGARKGNGWFRLWENDTALEDPALAACYAEQLKLVFDPVARDYRDAKGVDVRVMSFGTTRGFGTRNSCMKSLVAALEGMGYREGENLFGAPYDFRYAPAPPGQPALQFSDFVSSLRLLIERASERNGNKPVILVTHSYGGANAAEFLNQNTVQWRRRYVKHFIMVSMGAGGGVPTLQSMAPTTTANTPIKQDVQSAGGNIGRTFGSAFMVLPTPIAFGHAPLVITRAKNYSAYDMPELLAAAGFSDDEVARYRTRVMPVAINLFRAPIVPMTCINAVGVETVEKLVYWDGDLGAEPEVVMYGDGDGIINLASFLALDTVIGGDPDQEHYKSVFIPNTTHSGIMTDDFALELVLTEILEANSASY